MTQTYTHLPCNSVTTVDPITAASLADSPTTFCAFCFLLGPTGADGEFEWTTGGKVGAPPVTTNQGEPPS